MNRLEDNCRKLHSQIDNLKYVLFLSILVTVLTAILTIYVLKDDFKDSANQQYCHPHHDI